jgi:hypothetical protein
MISVTKSAAETSSRNFDFVKAAPLSVLRHSHGVKLRSVEPSLSPADL